MTIAELAAYVATFTIDYPMAVLGKFELFTVVPQGFSGVVVVVRVRVSIGPNVTQMAEAGQAVDVNALATMTPTQIGNGIAQMLGAFASDLMNGSLIVGGVRPWPSKDLVAA